MNNLTEAQLWDRLHQVKDPEIPVIDVIEMGIVRAIKQDHDTVTVTITPTYSGCPAMDMISKEIKANLRQQGCSKVEVETVLAPAWTTDWMSETAKEKLREYGIAPPKATCSAVQSPFEQPNMQVACPACGSASTELRSRFGSTPCKAQHYCNGCHQPFESFKCI